MENKKRLEKKDFYTEEELLTSKLPYRGETFDEILMKNIYNIMFVRAGYDYTWAKKHDLKDLHVIDIVAFKGRKEYDAFKDTITNILKKQLGLSKKRCEYEASVFGLWGGLTYFDSDEEKSRPLYMDENKFKENIKFRIQQYEKKNGELKYEDGYENELKAYCNYNDQQQ